MPNSTFLDQITIRPMLVEHAAGVGEVIDEAFYHDPGFSQGPCEQCVSEDTIRSACSRFPEGQFVAVHHDGEKETVVGIAITMKTKHQPNPEKTHPWWEFVGTYHLHNHDADGDWLYGVEMAVRPTFHRRGIGSALYQARFELVQRLNLKGWYAGGMLMGYHRYREQMTALEYGQKVIAGELNDPTVTMQKNRGFELWGVIENYLEDKTCGNAAVLIVWKNPTYRA